MKVLQVNLGRGRAAHDLVFLSAEEEGTEVIVVAELNKKLVSSGKWLSGSRLDVGAYFRNRKLVVKE